MVLVNTQLSLTGGCQLTFDMQTPMELLKLFQLNSLLTVPNEGTAAANSVTSEVN